MDWLQFGAVIIAALGTIYLTGKSGIFMRKFQEIATGKAGCVPAEDLGFVTIHYFAGRGRAEAIRLLLEQANVPYNQTDFSRETWPEAKKAGVEKGLYTYGQVPAIVTSSGVSMVQQQAILHYLGRATGMDCDCEDMHHCEVLALGVEDARSKLSKLVYDPSFSVAMRDEYLKEIAPLWLGYFEKIAPSISSQQRGYFVSHRLTWVDFLIFDLLDTNIEFDKLDMGRPPVAILAQFPKLNSYYNRMKALPSIANYQSSPQRPPFKIPYMPKPESNAKQM
ncbi:glutathione S-transferase P-like [Strongylocentrotus purpuratus]|uniref:Glutathione transferase n=1 Tax=Strongylocentrotus purpuratus TaxID=7668 RepID=A0A7M7PK85_STRPU|nr:glutathione S-transferase P-like [Strongylocentrotus purpuratus]